MPDTAKPAVLVCRAVFADIVDRLRHHFEVETNEDDAIWPRDELIRRLICGWMILQKEIVFPKVWKARR